MLARTEDSVSAAKTATEARTDTMNNLNDLIIGIQYYTRSLESQEIFSRKNPSISRRVIRLLARLSVLSLARTGKSDLTRLYPTVRISIHIVKTYE
jgi:flagellar basal body-associated protein FliL